MARVDADAPAYHRHRAIWVRYAFSGRGRRTGAHVRTMGADFRAFAVSRALGIRRDCGSEGSGNSRTDTSERSRSRRRLSGSAPWGFCWSAHGGGTESGICSPAAASSGGAPAADAINHGKEKAGLRTGRYVSCIHSIVYS